MRLTLSYVWRPSGSRSLSAAYGPHNETINVTTWLNGMIAAGRMYEEHDTAPLSDRLFTS